MDQKTLEYMGERVDKARNLQAKIKELKHFIEFSEGKSNITLSDNSGRGFTIEKRHFEQLAFRARELILKEIHNEIKLLEQELAEI